jgi:UDP-N-acetyl-D-galactosamine dehydrogenase
MEVVLPIYEQLLQKKAKLAVIGLGYVGLPIALEFAKHLSVIGFDISQTRVEMMQNRQDPSKELPESAFDGVDIQFTTSLDTLAQASFFVVAVPTPVDEHKVPNLTPVLSASVSVGKVLKKGGYVVFESTVYPGCTEEDCLPLLEKHSGLKTGNDFKLGYSPERINPGDKEHTITSIIKVVSGCDAEALEQIAKVYEIIVKAGVHKAPTIKVAEAAKIIENTQRDLNIALMNELALIFDRMHINTLDVLAAARTKWNFLPFYPGLVGGHCIGVDPYYLTYKSTELGYKPEVILSGRNVNDYMASYIAKRATQMMIRAGKNPSQARVLVMGITFKENVSDIRNSKIVDLVRDLAGYSVNIDIVDPYASNEEFTHEYGLSLTNQIGNNYDCVIVAVNHHAYCHLDEAYFEQITNPNAILIDVKGIYNKKITRLTYWTL